MADEQNEQKAVPGAVAPYVPATSRPAVSKDAPPISTKSPEPLAEHVDVFQAAADREAKIRLTMTEKACTWPEAVAIVDGTPPAPDPLADRLKMVELVAADSAGQISTLKSIVNALSSRVYALEQAAAAKPATGDTPIQ